MANSTHILTKARVRLSNTTWIQFKNESFPIMSEGESVLHTWCVQSQWDASSIVGGRGAHFWDADGHVRGGHGLLAVIELVSDVTGREPLVPWPQTASKLTELVRKALTAGVSFAVRGNLILRAPLLVIEEHELRDTLALLERLLTDMESA